MRFKTDGNSESGQTAPTLVALPEVARVRVSSRFPRVDNFALLDEKIEKTIKRGRMKLMSKTEERFERQHRRKFSSAGKTTLRTLLGLKLSNSK